jgi:uncharacterized RDD family membrane protein YckC
MMTASMTNGRMPEGRTAAGLPNGPPGEDPAISGRFRAADTVVEPAPSTSVDSAMSAPSVGPNVDSWRVEVTARLERYRTRRKPRTPRYPSLLLPFDAPESWSRPAQTTASPSVATGLVRHEQYFALEVNEGPRAVAAAGIAELRQASQSAEHIPEPIRERGPERYPHQIPEPSTNVIEFPRSAAIPGFHPSDLADPVYDRDRPRIVEVPEILPPPPALGGMLMEPVDHELADRDADLLCMTPSASIGRRAFAALVDGAVLTMALAAFAAIVFRLNPTLYSVRGQLPLARPVLGGAAGVVAVLLWAAYKFLFVVYSGSTLGLRAARLQLAGFDGSPLTRRTRRWRVLASYLSAFSAGLGYFWCVLDRDGLCWHDRITRTHVQSAVPPE